MQAFSSSALILRVRRLESAQHRWRAVNSAHLVALVRAGSKFENGVLVERPDESASGDPNAA
jgi:putative transposase